MQVSIPLDKMTTEDKLRVLEEIWDDLRKEPENVPSPPWHEGVLRAREEQVQEGKAKFKDWTEAKRKIREKSPGRITSSP